MRTSEALQATREHLLRVGWTQGVFEDAVTGACCLVGALRQVGDLEAEFRAQSRLQAVTKMMGLATWNDVTGRTLEQVLAAIHEAQDLAIAEGD